MKPAMAVPRQAKQSGMPSRRRGVLPTTLRELLQAEKDVRATARKAGTATFPALLDLWERCLKSPSQAVSLEASSSILDRVGLVATKIMVHKAPDGTVVHEQTVRIPRRERLAESLADERNG